MKIRTFCLSLLAVLFLAGCETDHYYDQVVQNDSSHPLTLIFHGAAANDFGDSIVVPQHESKTLYTFHKLGAIPEGLSCLPNLDSIEVIHPAGKSFLGNFLEEGNWTSQVEGKRTVMQTCTFRFSDADFN